MTPVFSLYSTKDRRKITRRDKPKRGEFKLQGSICAGDFEGTHVLRFHGDVRVPQCASLDAYCERMLQDPGFHAVVIDLESTDNLDSTTLGCLARLSIRVKKLNQRVPTLICSSNNLCKVLSSMGFHDVFMIVDQAAYETLSVV